MNTSSNELLYWDITINFVKIRVSTWQLKAEVFHLGKRFEEVLMASLYLTVSYEEDFDCPGIRTANQFFKEFLCAQTIKFSNSQ